MNFKKIGVIGGGTMGQGIAEMLAAKAWMYCWWRKPLRNWTTPTK